MNGAAIPSVMSPSDIAAIARAGDYVAYNERRYRSALAACRSVRPDPLSAVLDIGSSDFTTRLRAYYREVWTLGFPGPSGQHIVHDLNDVARTGIDTDARFDLICFNEVIEHLYTAPEQVLAAVAALLRPGGHLIVQTPNAAALNKRLALLIGRNPYERIRTDRLNPGHFRELTKAELAEVATGAGLAILDHRCLDYTGVYGRSWRNVALPLLRLAARLHPPFARSQQIVLYRP